MSAPVRQPRRYPPNDPREWLNRARSNLSQAQGGAQAWP